MTINPRLTGSVDSLLDAGWAHGQGSGTDFSDAGLGAKLDAMCAVMTRYLPKLANCKIVLDSGTLVGELTDGINRELGRAYL